jgi:hypothetical protein
MHRVYIQFNSIYLSMIIARLGKFLCSGPCLFYFMLHGIQDSITFESAIF